MTQYWATNHRQIWTGTEHKYVCDIIKAVDGKSSVLHEGLEQRSATILIAELNELVKDENSK